MERGNWPAHSAAPAPCSRSTTYGQQPGERGRCAESRSPKRVDSVRAVHRAPAHAPRAARADLAPRLERSRHGPRSPRHAADAYPCVREQVRECQTCVCLPCGFKPTRRIPEIWGDVHVYRDMNHDVRSSTRLCALCHNLRRRVPLLYSTHVAGKQFHPASDATPKPTSRPSSSFGPTREACARIACARHEEQKSL